MKYIRVPVAQDGWLIVDRYDWVVCDMRETVRFPISEVAGELVSVLNMHNELVEACKAALSFIDDDADPYPLPGGYTLSKMKEVLNRVITNATKEK